MEDVLDIPCAFFMFYLNISENGHERWEQEPDGQHCHQHDQKDFLHFALLFLVIEIHSNPPF